MIARCLNEGFADEVSIKPTIRPESSTLQNMFFNGDKELPNADGLAVLDMDWIDENFELLERILKVNYQYVREPFSVERRRQFAKELPTDEEIRYAQNVVGYYFAYHVIDSLRKEGASDQELAGWRVRILQHSPQTLGELRDPASYLYKLQACLAA